MSESSTKCPICNTQNDPEASACQQCGFGFSLTQSLWPVYGPDDAPDEPTAPKAPDEPGPPDTPPQAEPPGEQEPPPTALRPPLPVETEDSDALARAHIADGVRAMRAGAPGRAQLEFEQALDLTNDPDIVRSAQRRLRELSGELDEAARLPARLAAPPAPRATERSQPGRPTPPAPRLSENLGWMSALRLGLTWGLINGALTGCGAVFCVGLAFAPLFGLTAGWWVAKQAQENAWPTSAGHALLAGLLVGLGGGLGQLIGYPVWLRLVPNEEFNSNLQCFACCLGSIYVAITLALSALGWKLKTSR